MKSNYFLVGNKYWHDIKFICAIAILVNFIISYSMLLHQQPFNVDGLWYLNAAEGFLSGGYKLAKTIYPWPFYSILIACLSKLTHLPLESAAFLLNAFLTATMVTAFILLVKEMGGGVQVQYLAMLVILIYPFLNHDRYHILRDFGYYAFLLLSVLFYLRYLSQLNWRYAMSWNVSLIIATLFRIEGIILLVLVPFFILLKTDLSFKQRIKHFTKIYLPIFIGIILLLIIIIFKYEYVASLGRITDLVELIKHGYTVVFQSYISKQQLLAKSVIPYAPNSTFIFILGGLAALFLQALWVTLGWFYVLLISYGFKIKALPKHNDVRITLSSYSIVILITLLLFMIQNFFLAERYIEPLCLVLMLVIPFALSNIYLNWTKQAIYLNNKSWLFPVIGLVLLITALDGLGHFGPSKTYIIQAGNWVNQHTTAQDKVYANDPQLAYYTKRPGMRYPESFSLENDTLGCFDKRQHLTYYTYAAFKVGYKEFDKEKQIKEMFNKSPEVVINNTRGDKVLIFKIDDNLKNKD